MQAALLAFDKAPPFAAPLRFFITAPLFLALAGVALLIEGPAALVSRWMPISLAVVHLVTIGFMLMVMVGALFQILPVVTGACLPRPAAAATVVHAALGLGTLCLVSAFVTGKPALFIAAAALLGGGALVFVIAAAIALSGVPTTSPTIGGLKLSFFGLAGVVFLGAWLALALGQSWVVPLVEMVNLHAAWGFAAWGGTLLAAVCYVVVPMFHLTPAYRARPSWWLPPLLLAFTLLWTLAVLVEQPLGARLAEAILALLGAAFAVYTFYLQAQRRRARIDVPTRYWQCGLICVALAMGMSLAAAISPELAELPVWSLLFGILLVAGGFVSLITGMLYRIVPFLVWLHLHEVGPAPSVGKILPEGRMRPQMWLYFATLAALVGAVFLPEFLARPAGALLVAAAVGLLLNLLAAARVYWDLQPRTTP